MTVTTDTARLDRLDLATVWVLLLLIVLSVVWPSPVLWLNERTIEAELAIDDEAFLGREAVQWDVAFWWIAGLALITIGRTDRQTLARSVRMMMTIADEARPRLRTSISTLESRRVFAVLSALGLLAILLVFVVDPLVHQWLISVNQSKLLEWTSLTNRFGGGIAPVLTALFIGVAGIARGRERLIRLFLIILGASVASGLIAQIAKLVTGRSRPELWHGATDFWSGGASFPSGHTLSLFVVAGAIALFVRSGPVRFAVLGAACAVAVARVITFRHWPSDVAFSALLALGCVWFFDHASNGKDETSHGRGRS